MPWSYEACGFKYYVDGQEYDYQVWITHPDDDTTHKGGYANEKSAKTAVYKNAKLVEAAKSLSEAKRAAHGLARRKKGPETVQVRFRILKAIDDDIRARAKAQKLHHNELYVAIVTDEVAEIIPE